MPVAPPAPVMRQALLELDERLQNEFARAPHWATPPRRHRSLPPPKPLDYRAWLGHVADCEVCSTASDDLAALRRRDLEWEPSVPCPVGIRLLPLADVDAACGGFDRSDSATMLRRLVAHARELDGWGAEAHMSPGQAWGRLA